jgi:hypothetical protein
MKSNIAYKNCLIRMSRFSSGKVAVESRDIL